MRKVRKNRAAQNLVAKRWAKTTAQERREYARMMGLASAAARQRRKEEARRAAAGLPAQEPETIPA